VDASSIFGTLTATGRLFLINPNGILFGANSHIDTAGLVASSLDISNSDFLAGRYTFVGQGGSVVNQGYISSPGGFVALLGSTVENSGTIEANLGTVSLASGEAITLGLDAQSLISVVVDEATTENLENKDDAVKNTGTIQADGGCVILTAQALDGVFKRAVNNEGIIEANSLINNKGKVYLLAEGENALVSNIGTIDVSGIEEGAEGGFVEISGPRVNVGGDIKLAGMGAADGELLIDPFGDLYIVTDGALCPLTGESYELKSTLEGLGGSHTYAGSGDIELHLGENWIGGTWVENASWNDELSLFGITDGNFFKLAAGGSIRLFDDSIVTGGGDIKLSADTNNNGVGVIDFGTGAGIASNGGYIGLSAVDIILSAAVNADSGKIVLNTKNQSTAQVAAMNADELLILGKGNFDFDGVYNTIDTLAAEIDGSLAFANFGDLTIGSVFRPWTGVYYNGIQSTGSVSVKTQSDLILKKSIQAINTVSLDINGALIEHCPGYKDIVADSLELKLVNGIHDNLGWNNTLETKVSNLAVSNSGSGVIDILNTGTLTITQVDGTTGVVNDAGDVILGTRTAGSDLIIEEAIKALGNTVSLDVTGMIDDHRDGYGDIVAKNLEMRAVNGIGDTFFVGINNNLETEVEKVAAYNLVSGDININNTGDLIIGTVGSTSGIHNDAPVGNVNVTTHSNLTLENSIVAADTVSLNIDGYITDHYDGYRDVVAENLEINTVNGIFDDFHSQNNDLETTVSNLAVHNTGSGSVNINNTGTLTVTQVNDTVGVINDAGDVNLYTCNISSGADLIIEEPIKAVGHSVLLDVEGAIDDQHNGWDDVVANNLEIRSVNGVADTTQGNKWLETMVNNLAAVNTTSGDINIRNTGDLNITTVGSTSGVVNTTTAGGNIDIKVKNGSLNVLQDVLMQQTGDADAAIILDADNAMNIESRTVQTTVTGNGNSSVDLVTGSGNINVNPGSIVAAVVTGNGDATITADAADSIIVTDSIVTSTVGINGDATITLNAVNNITVDPSIVVSYVANDGNAAVNLNAGGNIVVDSSIVSAIVGNVGSAKTTLLADKSIIIKKSILASAVQEGIAATTLVATDYIVASESVLGALSQNGAALTSLLAGKSIIVNKSILASAVREGLAATTLAAGEYIIVNESILASLAEDGVALTSLLAGKSIVVNKSILAAAVKKGLAVVRLDAGENIKVNKSIMVALAKKGMALVSLNANGNITINKSILAAAVKKGLAVVRLDAGENIKVNKSIMVALAKKGMAIVSLNANGNITIKDSRVASRILANGYATTKIKSASGDIDITDSSVLAAVMNDGNAKVSIETGNGSIEIDPSIISAFVGGNGNADVYAYAENGGLTIIDSEISAIVSGNGDATVDLRADNDVLIDPSSILASVLGDGNAFSVVKSENGAVDIKDSTVSATVSGVGDAQTWIEANGEGNDVTLVNSTIQASAADSDSRSEANLIAWNGAINSDADSLVSAQYAWFLAKYNIGASDSPIKTEVDYLSAYSWWEGDIYIDELDDITLGALIEYEDTFYGIPVAANNGIINISSGGDMTVNSVVSPRGGVFLESREGSIYAGQGWCPAGEQEEIKGLPAVASIFASFGAMNVSGTQWADAGVTAFAPVVVIDDDSDVGPNVIAGGYSYFSAPNGTIGVGKASGASGPDGDDPATLLNYNPLKVCIQVLSGNLGGNNSAVPEIIYGIGAIPIAGLTLDIGGVVPSSEFNDGYNGPIGVSGAIEGIVRPGTTAITGVYPSPALVNTIDTNGTGPGAERPSGYVFYDDTDANCCPVFLGSIPADNTGPKYIWPSVPVGMSMLLPEDFRLYYELSSNFRVSMTPALRATEFFAYHPLSSADYTAFDDITLEFEAYEFIQDSIDLKKKKKLSPFFGAIEEEDDKELVKL